VADITEILRVVVDITAERNAALRELDAARAEVERLRGVIYEYVKAIDDNAGSGLDLELEAAQLRYEHAVEALRAETNQ
jgi:hypothetical protein